MTDRDTVPNDTSMPIPPRRLWVDLETMRVRERADLSPEEAADLARDADVFAAHMAKRFSVAKTKPVLTFADIWEEIRAFAAKPQTGTTVLPSPLDCEP